MSYTDTKEKMKHNSRPAHKWTAGCCGASEKSNQAKSSAIKNRKEKKPDLEARSKKAGFYVHGHKNFGDVYEA